MSVIDASRMQDIEARYPDILHRSFRQRFGALMIFIGVILYGIYAVWFFDLPKVIAEAHWERFGIYLSQWISYDVQPEFRLGEEKIVARFPRYSPLGQDPHPDWVKQNANGSAVVEVDGTSRMVAIAASEVAITAHGDLVVVSITSGQPKISGHVPSWVTVYDDKIVANLGFSGDVNVTSDRVKIRKRFLGWPNFIFDTRSHFFNKSPTEVMNSILSGPEFVKGTPNWMLALDEFWSNSEWQHGDVWTKLFQTIVMAFLGTLLGSFISFPLAFLAARNITRNFLMNQVFKRLFDFLRSVDMLIWALFLTRAFGPGPLSGSGAIFLTETGTLGKLYAESLENIDDKPREGVRATGASAILVQRYGVIPQIIPVMVSQTLYQWESNVRGATIIGAVGAGGIGLKLWEAMSTNKNWENVAYMVVLILIVVFTFDTISNAFRSRLMGNR